MIHGSMILFRALETALCHELTKLSANTASIFHSRILSQTAKKRLGSSAPANMAINLLTQLENRSQLPSRKNLGDSKELAQTFTEGTFSAPYSTPRIEEFLKKS